MKETAQQQAKRIVENARKQASLIRERAQKQAEVIRLLEQGRRARNHERAVKITKTAEKAKEHAVRMFRINAANTMTLLNGVCGFLSILASMQGNFFLASGFILIGVLLDWLDGRAARYFGESSLLGKELDSLSDFVTFGVAPAVLVAVIDASFVSYFAGALFVLSAALRLGRFNIQEVSGVFFGVPTTTNGVLLPLMVYLGAPTTWFPIYLFVMALLMNAPIKIKKVF